MILPSSLLNELSLVLPELDAATKNQIEWARESRLRPTRPARAARAEAGTRVQAAAEAARNHTFLVGLA